MHAAAAARCCYFYVTHGYAKMLLLIRRAFAAMRCRVLYRYYYFGDARLRCLLPHYAMLDFSLMLMFFATIGC